MDQLKRKNKKGYITYDHASATYNYNNSQFPNQNDYSTLNQFYFQNTQITCEEHSGELITNYDCALDQLKPLCPECVTPQFQHHVINATQPQIESIKNVKINCTKKVKAAIGSLNNEMEKAELQYLINPEQLLEDNQIKLRKIKQRVLSLVENFFDNQEGLLRKKIDENLIKAGDFNLIFDKISLLIIELEALNNQLYTDNYLPIIRKICLLDLKSMNDKFKNEIHKVISHKNIDPISIHTDDNQLFNLQNILQKICSLSKFNKEPKSLQQFNQNSNISIHHPIQTNQLDNYLHKTSTANQSPQKKAINSTGSFLFQQQGDFEVTKEDYFNHDTSNKILHFFYQKFNKKNKIYMAYAHLAESKVSRPKFIEMDIKQTYQIPDFHKSIITPSGDIYLIGGIDQKNGQKSDLIYFLDFSQKSLLPMGRMRHARSSHGICYNDGYIYIIGGFLNNQKMTNHCERYKITNNSNSLSKSDIVSQNITELNHAASSLCVTGFNGEYLFKFGGIAENRQLNPFIESYHIDQNTWNIIDPQIFSLNNFALLSTSCCAQINEENIIVFGGYTESNVPQNLTYLLNVRKSTIQCINSKPLPFAEGFWNNTALVQNQCLYALQNVPCLNSKSCLENQSKILQFDGKTWKILN